MDALQLHFGHRPLIVLVLANIVKQTEKELDENRV